ncbi:crossover junction endodeoxyribonuclease RuvC [Haliscomenobacter sp.]|uniref:crossover junction endodeoxyribonuclease RuvC n=1 Tax=Haliscomenobacter sp. TaxID=2717303 RepID=UPI003BAD2671
MAEKLETYRILGVDPGTNILGYAILEVKGDVLLPVDIGVVYLKQFEDHPQKLQRIFERITSIISQYGPRYLAIEAPFFGKNPQSMLKLGRAQGVAMAAAITKGLEITEYSPKKIKQSVTGNGNAAKEQVAAMLQNTLKVNLDGQYLDATDALAAAVCHYYQSRSPFGGAGKKYNDWGAFLKENPERGKGK